VIQQECDEAIATTTATCALLALAPASVRAQDAPGEGFGKRDSLAFTVENLLGFVSNLGRVRRRSPVVRYPRDAASLLGDLGLFSMSPTGFNWGALVGVGAPRISDSGDATVLRLRPRVGWAVSKNDKVGFWLRGGPSLLMFRATGDEDSSSSSQAMLALGAEAYAVFTLVEHVGILVGPHADIHLLGSASEGDDPSFSTFGVSLGLLGEIW